jgi:anti-sigma B factor antagonist
VRESSTSPFQIGMRGEPDAVIIALSGEFDLDVAAELAPCVAAAVEAGHGDVVIDLAEVSFIDSSGIAAILRERQQVDGHRLLIRNARQNIRRVFGMAGLSDVLDGDSAVGVDGDGEGAKCEPRARKPAC